MRAIVCTKHGSPDVLELQEVEKPTPNPNEVLIRVQATTVTTGDVNARGFLFVPPGLGFLARLMLGFRKPKYAVLGSDVAGEIEAVGQDVRAFSVGDRVFGVDGDKLGGYAEYVCRPEDGTLSEMPANLSYEEAVSIPFGALTALHFLREKGKISAGSTVLVNGASGSVGSAAVQLAKYFGAVVTGVCSTANIELVRSLGADSVVDYTQDDFRQRGETYDIILDTVVGHTSFARCRGTLSSNGRYLAVAGGLREMLQTAWTTVVGNKKVVFGGGAECETREGLDFLRDRMTDGSIKPLVDRTYPLEQIVEAHRYVDTGHKKGNVVVTVADGRRS